MVSQHAGMDTSPLHFHFTILTALQISDLLASISGGSAAPTPAKRKAEDDIKPRPKIARETPPSAKPAQLSRPLDRPNGSSKPYSGTSKANGAKDSLKPLNGANRVTKPAPPARPVPSSNGGSNGAVRAQPKKGSYAEIMARASKAQQSMGQFGRIQHKKVEKKDREAQPQTKPDPRTPGAKRPAGTPGYQGTAKAGARPPMNGRNGLPSKDPRSGPPGNGKGQQGKTAAQEEHEKKVKKAAAATTGYTGTARPKPNSMPSKKNAPPSRGGALLNHAPSRSSKYNDEYDEELDDFIDYDEDEDDGYGYGGRPQPVDYDSDASSDMEGGFDDMELEDKRAEMIARREDIEEERAEKKHKAEKEERKRRYLEQMRAKGR